MYGMGTGVLQEISIPIVREKQQKYFKMPSADTFVYTTIHTLNTGTPSLHAFFHQKFSIFFLLLDENICCGYSLEGPHRGASNEYPQHMFSSSNKKTIYLIPTLI